MQILTRPIVRALKSQRYAIENNCPPELFIRSQPWIDRDEVLRLVKASVPEIDGSEATAPIPAGGDDFLEAIRATSVLDKLAEFGAQQVPARVRLLGQSAGAISYWIGNGRPIPLSSFDLVGDNLPLKTVGALVVTSNELLRDASPEGEAMLGRDLANAAASAIDYAIIDPGNTGSDYTPAAITAGVTPLVSAGATLANIDADLQRMLAELVALGSPMQRAVWIMHPRTAVSLSLLRGTGGAPAFPGIGAAGGSLLGLPVITSGNVPREGSPAEASITLVDASDVAWCDGGAAASLSSQTMIEMSDAPTGSTVTPTGASAVSVSLFQAEATAIKVVRRCNWKLRRGLVSVLTDVTY